MGGARFYSGGKYERKEGFDADKFGYFDVLDEVKKLGYVKWNCIAYKIPKSFAFMDLKQDKDVMQMLRHLSNKCKCSRESCQVARLFYLMIFICNSYVKSIHFV